MKMLRPGMPRTRVVVVLTGVMGVTLAAMPQGVERLHARQGSASPPALLTVQSASISGIVLDADGKPAPGVAIAYQRATEIRAKAESSINSPTPGSPRAAGIASGTPAQKQAAIEAGAKINPSMIYVGGTPAGFTDTSGAFTIKGLPSDSYVVTAANKNIRQSGSQQPIVVKDGEQIKISVPIKMKRDPGRGGSLSRGRKTWVHRGIWGRDL